MTERHSCILSYKLAGQY